MLSPTQRHLLPRRPARSTAGPCTTRMMPAVVPTRDPTEQTGHARHRRAVMPIVTTSTHIAMNDVMIVVVVVSPVVTMDATVLTRPTVAARAETSLHAVPMVRDGRGRR